MTWGELADDAAGVSLLGLLVEHLGRLAQVVGPFHQVVQLHAALQHRVDRLVLQGTGLRRMGQSGVRIGQT